VIVCVDDKECNNVFCQNQMIHIVSMYEVKNC
jgi:hypothetical protein